jgi:hypothetical protein
VSIFEQIFDVFSARPEAASKPKHPVAESTRTRILMWCQEVFGNKRAYYSSGDYSEQFWNEIHRFLRFRIGQMQLSPHPRSAPADAIQYVMTCPGEQFLDFLEDMFRVDCYFHVGLPDEQVVEELNALLRKDGLPYHVTDFIKQTAREVVTGGPFGGGEHDVIRTIAHPKVIMRENEVVHSQAIRPVLELLQRPEYSNASSEYLTALEDYRKDDFGDCLTKCGSAFESVLKIICHRKGWPYKQTNNAGQLVQTFLNYTKLDPYFDQPLMTTAVLRNKLSTSHGAGAQNKQVPRHVALYALNVTASAILFVTQEAG